MPIRIPLGGKKGAGQYALVSLRDRYLKRYRWSLDSEGYPQARVDGRVVRLHKLIMPQGRVDHIDRNRLNNVRSNLRYATALVNGNNRVGWTGATSPYRGVFWDRRRNKWRGEINYNYRRYYIGMFSDDHDAHMAVEARRAQITKGDD